MSSYWIGQSRPTPYTVFILKSFGMKRHAEAAQCHVVPPTARMYCELNLCSPLSTR
ncbi:putative transmembrane dehydrogenase (Large subunit) oxidoreductase domain protein [Burkholderia mallei]|nr:putative transmembrane dehydrogenase (Large subunit) oxidoreductase domain protein [Burkholderia mallei]KOS94212.1 putative transmembrane dehydrogenase (Large subunit) oxidoreductase domain protein [Burkholderia mallei]KOT10656.1 putative transmembrane dehydrogenase (Large subunit) oxidoreductase domain protein [Burkholderia mallei]